MGCYPHQCLWWLLWLFVFGLRPRSFGFVFLLFWCLVFSAWVDTHIWPGDVHFFPTQGLRFWLCATFISVSAYFSQSYIQDRAFELNRPYQRKKTYYASNCQYLFLLRNAPAACHFLHRLDAVWGPDKQEKVAGMASWSPKTIAVTRLVKTQAAPWGNMLGIKLTAWKHVQWTGNKVKCYDFIWCKFITYNLHAVNTCKYPRTIGLHGFP